MKPPPPTFKTTLLPHSKVAEMSMAMVHVFGTDLPSATKFEYCQVIGFLTTMVCAAPAIGDPSVSSGAEDTQEWIDAVHKLETLYRQQMIGPILAEMVPEGAA